MSIPSRLETIETLATTARDDLGQNAADGPKGRPTVAQLNRTLERLDSIAELARSGREHARARREAAGPAMGGRWTVESCEPSDGSKVCGLPVDHRADIVRRKEGEQSAFMMIQCASVGMSGDGFESAVAAMVAALNAKENAS